MSDIDGIFLARSNQRLRRGRENKTGKPRCLGQRDAVEPWPLSPIALHPSYSWPAHLYLLPLAFSNSARLDYPHMSGCFSKDGRVLTTQTSQRASVTF